MSSALAGCATRTNHLKFLNRREQHNSLNKINENKDNDKTKAFWAGRAGEEMVGRGGREEQRSVK
jgi:hypothetical protein